MHSNNNTFSALRGTLAALAIGTLWSGATLADMPALNPDSTVNVSGTTVAAHPELAGTVLEDQLAHWDDGNGTSGWVQTRVVREDVAGTLDFYYRFYEGSGFDSVWALRTTGFDGFMPVNVDYRTDGLGAFGPDTVKGIGTGGINWVFTDGFLTTGNNAANSYFMLVQTDAMYYTIADADVLTFSYDETGKRIEYASNIFSVFAPAVPEPETYAMLIAGLGLVGFAYRRKRSKAS